MNVQFRGMIVGGVKAGQWFDHFEPFVKYIRYLPLNRNNFMKQKLETEDVRYDHYPLRFEDKDGKEHNMDLWLLEGMKPSEALFQIYEGYAESCRKSRDQDHA